MGGYQFSILPVTPRRFAGAFGLLLLAVCALPALCARSQYVNKLAPYVASPARVVDRMLELANIRPGETVYDLGCGDGRILIAAVQTVQGQGRGHRDFAQSSGRSSRPHSRRPGLASKAQVIEGDLLDADLTGADVVTIYLATSLNEELRPRLEKFLKPGARVVSHDYAVPGWKPTKWCKPKGGRSTPSTSTKCLR